MTARSVLRIAGLLVGGLVLLLIVGVILLHTPPVRRYALQQVSSILSKQGVTFSAADLDYNLLDLTATLRNFAVRSPAAPGLPPVLTADIAQVDLGLRQLVNGRYRVEDAVLTNPKIHIVIDEQGRDNIPRLPEKKEEGKTDWLIQKLRSSGGSFTFEDRRQKLVATLPAWQLSIDGSPITNDQTIRLETQRAGRVDFQQRALPIDGLSADLVLKDRDKAIEVKSLRLASGATKLDLAGTIDNLEKPVMDIKLDTNLSIASLIEFTGVKQRAEGDLKLQVSATGSLAEMKLAAKINGEDLVIQRFQRVDLAANAVYDLPAKRLKVSSLNVGSPAGSLQATADVATTTDVGDSTLNARIGSLDIEALGRTLGLSTLVASRVTGTVSGRWPGLAYEKASGQAHLRLTPTRSVPTRNVVPVGGVLSATGNGDRINVAVESVRALDASANGRLVISGGKQVSGEVKLDATDVGATFEELAAFLGRTQLVAMRVSGPAEITANISGTTSRPQVAAVITSSGLQVGELKDVGLNIDATYTSDKVAVRSANIRWRDQTITTSGSLGLAGPDRTLEFEASAQQISIASVLAGLGRTDVPAAGSVTLTTTIGGTVEYPVANVTITGTNLEAYSEPLGNLVANARIEKDTIYVDRLRLDKQDGFLQATGAYNLEAKGYTIDAEGRNLTLTQLTLPGGMLIRGQLNLMAKGNGTTDNPQLALKLNADGMEVRKEQLGSMELAANVAGQQARVELSAPGYNLAAKAVIKTQAPYPAQFGVEFKGTDLAKLPVRMERPITGVLTASVTGTANLQDPESADITARIADLNLKVNDQPIRNDGPMEVRYASRILEFQQAAFLVANSRATVEGRLPLDEKAGPGEVRVRGQFDVGSLAALVPQEQPVTATGTLTLDAILRGTLRRIDPTATLALANGTISSPGLRSPVGDLNLSLQVRDGAATIEQLSANWAGAKITGSGVVPFALLPADLPVELPRRAEPADFRFDLQGLQLAAVTGERVTGTVSLHAELRTPSTELTALEGRITFPELRMQAARFELQQQGTSTIAVANGVARVEQFELRGPESRFALTGTAGLTGTRAVDLRVEGNLDAALLALVTDRIQAAGDTVLQVAIAGTLEKPEISGFVELNDAQVAMESPAILTEDLAIRLELAGNRLNIAKFTGDLNGGKLDAKGGLSFAGGELRDVDISVGAKNFYLELPEGLQTISSAVIKLQSQDDHLVLAGDVEVIEGSYTQPITIEAGLLRYLRRGQEITVAEERSRILSELRLNIGARTISSLVVDNNLARAAINMDVRVRGTPSRTGLTGRITVEEGGELYLSERTYLIDRGVVTFTNDQRIEPVLDLLARTRAADYDITMRVETVGNRTETVLTSDPPLPEPDIVAVLVTGRTLDETRGAEMDIAREQVLSLLAGSIGGTFSRQAQQATGLTQVRIEPNLIASETEPTARLTVGQDITRKLGLIYSMNLRDSSDQIWIGKYDLSKRFSTQTTKQNDNSYRFEFRHDLLFGGRPDPTRAPGDFRRRKDVGQVGFKGNPLFSEKQLMDWFKVKPGKEYDFFKVRKGLDRLEKKYAEAGRLESRVRLDRRETETQVNLDVQVRPGPKVEFVYEGWNVSGDTKKDIRKVWDQGVFDAQRTKNAIDLIRAELIEKKYVQAEVTSDTTAPSQDEKRVLFEIQPGKRFKKVELVFDGASGIKPSNLKDLLDEQKLETEVYTNPRQVTEFLEKYYRERGYLDATIDKPRYELGSPPPVGVADRAIVAAPPPGAPPPPQGPRVVIPVHEGVLYRVGAIEFEGNTAATPAELTKAIFLKPGGEYTPDLRERSYTAIQDVYYDRGYSEVEIDYTQSKHPDAGTVDVVFRIKEGLQRVVADVRILDNQHTSENLIRTQIGLRPGDIASSNRISRARRNLYQTAAYSLVDIELEPVDGASGLKPHQRAVRLVTRVREVRPFELRYGAFFDTERGPGGIADISNRNMLGSARVIGLRTRYDSQFREGRIYFTQPTLLRFPLQTNAATFVTREIRDVFITDRVGVSVQQEARFREHYILSYGYRLERTHTFDREPDALIPFDERLRVAPLNTTITRETRDEMLDATRGSMTSHAFEWASSELGSQLRFIRYFGQYFKYVPLGKEQRVPWSNRLKTRFVYAGGVRVGLARGLGGQDLVPSERFFAGGGTTIRGFQQDRVGPLLVGEPIGGNAVLIINNEVRHPLFWIVDGVGFVDAGNVYPKVSDFSFSDIRKSAGVGVRLRTPYFLLRLDYGVKLDRRPGERVGQLFFSIGQAF